MKANCVLITGTRYLILPVCLLTVSTALFAAPPKSCKDLLKLQDHELAKHFRDTQGKCNSKQRAEANSRVSTYLLGLASSETAEALRPYLEDTPLYPALRRSAQRLALEQSAGTSLAAVEQQLAMLRAQARWFNDEESHRRHEQRLRELEEKRLEFLLRDAITRRTTARFLELRPVFLGTSKERAFIDAFHSSLSEKAKQTADLEELKLVCAEIAKTALADSDDAKLCRRRLADIALTQKFESIRSAPAPSFVTYEEDFRGTPLWEDFRRLRAAKVSDCIRGACTSIQELRATCLKAEDTELVRNCLDRQLSLEVGEARLEFEVGKPNLGRLAELWKQCKGRPCQPEVQRIIWVLNVQHVANQLLMHDRSFGRPVYSKQAWIELKKKFDVSSSVVFGRPLQETSPHAYNTFMSAYRNAEEFAGKTDHETSLRASEYFQRIASLKSKDVRQDYRLELLREVEELITEVEYCARLDGDSTNYKKLLPRLHSARQAVRTERLPWNFETTVQPEAVLPQRILATISVQIVFDLIGLAPIGLPGNIALIFARAVAPIALQGFSEFSR
ncbi:MAG: hypothetical protein JNK87_05110 [Bryobacterales bacterium]|nr:hypothetical protein [Bryobacterales bacterium]